MRIAMPSLIFILALPASQALAQTPLPPRNEVRVNVSIGMTQPIAPNDKNSLADLQTKARKTIYENAANECKLLLATIASECTLESLNVNSNVRNQFYRGQNSSMFLTTNSTANFKIHTKN